MCPFVGQFCFCNQLSCADDFANRNGDGFVAKLPNCGLFLIFITCCEAFGTPQRLHDLCRQCAVLWATWVSLPAPKHSGRSKPQGQCRQAAQLWAIFGFVPCYSVQENPKAAGVM